ncbi:MarR family transcriptional regulator [Schumannella sp. 10F1B-5-1]|nr:MarR family transcriptional regulator [Schumannella sp. 10F1B-5-1]
MAPPPGHNIGVVPAEQPTTSAATRRLLELLDAHAESRAAALIAAREKLAITQMDARALEFIARHPGIRPSGLREHLHITSASVSTLTDRLVRRGLVRRDPDEEDRRATRLTALIDWSADPWSTLSALDSRLERAIAQADPADVDRAAALLETLLDAVDDGR